MDTRRTGERQSLVSPARSAAREEGFLCTEPHLALACCPFRRLPGEAGSAIRVRLAASSLCSLPCKAPSGSSRPPQLVHLSVHPPRPLLRPPFRGLPALPAGRGTALGGRARIARAPSGPSACSEPTGRAARSVGGAHAVLGNGGRARSRPALRGIGGSFNSRCSGDVCGFREASAAQRPRCPAGGQLCSPRAPGVQQVVSSAALAPPASSQYPALQPWSPRRPTGGQLCSPGAPSVQPVSSSAAPEPPASSSGQLCSPGAPGIQQVVSSAAPEPPASSRWSALQPRSPRRPAGGQLCSPRAPGVQPVSSSAAPEPPVSSSGQLCSPGAPGVQQVVSSAAPEPPASSQYPALQPRSPRCPAVVSSAAPEPPASSRCPALQPRRPWHPAGVQLCSPGAPGIQQVSSSPARVQLLSLTPQGNISPSRVRTGLLRIDVELTYLLRSSGPLAGLVRGSEHTAMHSELPADSGFPPSDPRWQAASNSGNPGDPAGDVIHTADDIIQAADDVIHAADDVKGWRGLRSLLSPCPHPQRNP
ncbi:hypothetical protein AB1E18_007071 [Capra hircus]